MESENEVNNVEDALWEVDIQRNLTALTESITNLDLILIRLMKQNIISESEYEIVKYEKTTIQKNFQLLMLLKRKGWSQVKISFLKILSETSNVNCIHLIDTGTVKNTLQLTGFTQEKLLQKFVHNTHVLTRKWWPDEKYLPNSFYERKENKRFFQKLKQHLTQKAIENHLAARKVVITGLAGVGKSTITNSYAIHNQKDYDHIISINCLEAELLQSFMKLSRTLDIKKREEMELKELALECFKSLRTKKCLWVFDKAQCYIGKGGIKDILPLKKYSTFHTILTSRAREWGNANGDGEIPELVLECFDKQEAVEFMNNNCKIKSDTDKAKLEVVCQLLGNLPLALQIAVSDLNRRNYMGVDDYIHLIKTTPHIIMRENFDDYKKAIHATMGLSLNLLINDERTIGSLARTILTTFAYIRPDNVDSDFFISVAYQARLSDYLFLGKSWEMEIQRRKAEIEESINLLELQSLITRSTAWKDKVEKNVLNINRVLQQVIRHNNSEETKNDTLRGIFNCVGFLEYKLLPYSLAEENLQKEYHKIGAKLIVKLNLIELLEQKRYEEAVELSRLIRNSKLVPCHILVFNFAMCLKQNLETQNAKSVLKTLWGNISEPPEEPLHYDDYFNEWGIITDTNKTLTKRIVAGQLLTIYIDVKNEENMAKVILDSNGLFLQTTKALFPQDILRKIVFCLDSTEIYPYFLEYDGWRKYISLILGSERQTKNNFAMKSGTVDHNMKFPNNLHELLLEEVQFPSNTLKSINFPLKKFSLKNLTVGLSEAVTITADEVCLCSVEISDWKYVNWIATKINFDQVEVRETKISAKEVIIYDSSFDILLLPEDLQILQMYNCTLLNFSNFLIRGISTLPKQLQELTLYGIKLQNSMRVEVKDFDFSQWILPSLKKLEMGTFFVNSSLSSACLQSIQSLDLWRCNLILTPEIRIAPKALTLSYVNILSPNGEADEPILVNSFIDFSQMKLLTLYGMSLDMSESLFIPDVNLIETNIVNWKNGKWKIDTLRIFPKPCPTSVVAKNFKIIESSEYLLMKNGGSSNSRYMQWLHMFKNGLSSAFCLK